MILALETSTATGGAALLEQDRLLASCHFTSPALHAQRLLPSVEWLLAQTGRDVSAISGVAVAIGPGSFTGLRIGLSAAKALAWANRVPLAGVSTLEALALRAATGCVPFSFSAGGSSALPPVCALLDARQGEVYAGLFRIEPPAPRFTPARAPASAVPAPESAAGLPASPLALPSLVRLREDYAGPLEAFLDESITSPTLFAGDGALKYRDRLQARLGGHFLPSPAIRNLPSAEEVAALGAARLARGQHDDPFLLAPDYLRRSYTQRRKS